METVKKTERNIVAIYSNVAGAYKMRSTSNSPKMSSPEFRDIISGYLEKVESYTDTLHLLVDNGEQLLFTVKKYQEDINQYLYDVEFTSEEFCPEDGRYTIQYVSEELSLEEVLDYIQSFKDFSVTIPEAWL